jgi:hypothetical protein
MTVSLALDLSHDGIRLLRRNPGDWDVLAEVRLDAPDLADRMRDMQAAALAEAGPEFETDLIIPPSQILYTRVGFDDGRSRIRDDDVRGALDGRTPVPVDDLVFDWRRDGDEVQVALLERKTLEEAEAFATGYGMNPVRFVARPDATQFPDTPDFGPTASALASEAGTAEGFATSRADPAPKVPQPRVPRPVSTSARRVPWTLPEGRRGPGLLALGALLVAALLIWTAYYLVSPTDDPSGPVVSAPDITEPAETSPVEDNSNVAEAPPRALESTPATTGDPSIAADQPATPSRAAPDRRPEPAIAALPGPPDGATAEELALRQTALFGPATEELAIPPEEFLDLVARNPIVAEDIWQVPPPPPLEPLSTTTDDIYLASVDAQVQGSDAVALAPPTSEHPAPPALPQPPEDLTGFELDDRGLVEATPEGTLTPDGIIVTLGRPPIEPRPRPIEVVILSDADIAAALALQDKRPRPRPGNLIEENQRAQLGGRTLAELGTLRPRPRPESPQIAAEAVAAAVAEANEDIPAASPNAVAVSRAPAHRPDNFAALVEQITAQRKRDEAASVSAAVTTPRQPNIPTSASVAREATIENALPLREVNLIGVYGAASDRRALVRLANGRYVKVRVGDSLDGGQVAAISQDALRYIKRGRAIVLQIPSG